RLKLTTHPAGTCSIYSDSILITFQSVPEVNAGPDHTICADSFYVALGGMVVNAGGGLWSTSGNGTFSADATQLNANYVPSVSDRSACFVALALTSTGNGPCPAKNDQMVLAITPAPTVDAGTDQVICADSSFVNLQ